jgi:hypothetical protein
LEGKANKPNDHQHDSGHHQPVGILHLGDPFVAPVTLCWPSARARPAPPCCATSCPGSATGCREEYHCHPSLPIWKLVCNDCHRNRECRYPARQSYCQTAQVKNRAEIGYHFAFNPSSTSRRMASERLTSLDSAHASTSAVRSTGSRTAETGSRPVAGRPRFFWFTLIDFAMNYGLPK